MGARLLLAPAEMPIGILTSLVGAPIFIILLKKFNILGQKEVTMLRASGIHYHAGKKQILKNVSAEFHAGEFNMILGPNGSGKSTFLKIFSGELAASEGIIQYDEKELRKIPRETQARSRAVMSQHPELSFPLTVEEVVMMGRYPHFDFAPAKKTGRSLKK